jgi:hypothetical protein
MFTFCQRTNTNLRNFQSDIKIQKVDMNFTYVNNFTSIKTTRTTQIQYYT